MRSRLLVLVLLLGVCLAPIPAQSQTTTGRLIGSVVDGASMPLPGATVEIESPSLIGGRQVKISAPDGDFSFLGLHPGNYTVSISLPGFVPQERNEVKVPLGGAAAIVVMMPTGAFANEIEIVAETPVVDPTQVNTEQIFDQAYLQNAAIGSANRSYQNVLAQAAGVTGGSNPNVFGSLGVENAYYVDGQDTTDPVTASFGTNFAFDAIAEIEFQTSGFEAEYGRAVGGIVNLVTKSGGNRFSGTFDARYRDTGYQESGDHFDADEAETSYQNFAATLGGPIVRDRLWFFASYNYVDSQTTDAGSPTTRVFRGNYLNAKLTWQAAPSWRVVGKFSSDPAEIDNRNQSQYVMPEAAMFSNQGADIYTAEVNAVLTDALMWNTVLGAYRSTLDAYPQDGDLVTAGTYDLATGISTDNYTNQQYSERNRDDLSTDLTWFVDNLAGSHEFKGGIQYSATDFSAASCATGTTGGACSPGSVGYFYYDLAGSPYFQYELTTAGTQQYQGTLWTAFVQDAWRVSRNLTLKIGVRQDQVVYDNNSSVQIADMGIFQPRIGVAWDLTGNAKNLLRGNWGRFMHPNSLTLPYRLRAAHEPYYRWYSCQGILGAGSAQQCEDFANMVGWDYMSQGYNPDRDPYGWILHPLEAYGTGDNQVDPNLGATYADTFSLSYEREVGNRAAVELTYINKQTRDITEDTCNGNFPDGPTVDADCSYYIFANLPEAKRDYQAVIVCYENRTFNWLTLLASYTWSNSEGSIEDTGMAGDDFDAYPWHFDNRYGFLSDHREHRLKLNGYFTIKGDWVIGFDAFWSSNFTWEPQGNEGDFPEMPGGFYYVEPRGSRDGDSASLVDLQLSKGFTIGRTRLVLIGTVFNVLSNEYATGVCDALSGCGGIYELGDYDTWATPRRYELGFRVEF